MFLNAAASRLVYEFGDAAIAYVAATTVQYVRLE